MISENYNFFANTDFEKYAGEWVAVANNKVVGVGSTASEAIIAAEKKTQEKTTIMKVPKRDRILIL